MERESRLIHLSKIDTDNLPKLYFVENKQTCYFEYKIYSSHIFSPLQNWGAP
jgi:hypothetical protein